MSLDAYSHKRRFDSTPEPKGKGGRGRREGGRLTFVVQEHHATTLHYDFRLELDGVLKSWAVPKGPSMDPHDHHLAIATEDHPYDYRKFEGVIPEGNYGAGNVIIWDEGWYEPRAETADPQKTLRAELKEGHVTFVVHGKKLQGEFALIKMPQAKEENAWLLIKKGDEFATASDITKQDESVVSHRRVDDLGGKLNVSTAPKRPKPWTVRPMLCTLVDEPFSRVGWLFEMKWDGYRAIGSRYKDRVELYSRNELDFRDRYPTVAEALRELKHDVILDGEIVAVDADGKPHFEWLQRYHQQPRGLLRYYVFDVLWCDGRDLRSLPLAARKAILRQVLPKDGVVRYGDEVTEDGLGLFKQIRAQGLEGVVAKRADSPYQEGVRGADWLKIKTGRRQEVVIGGYTEPRGTRKYLGSLLVGVYQDGQLVYCGHSGGGIADDERKALQAELARLERPTSPFAAEPKPNAPVHWVEPQLVCEMAFAEWTDDGLMRHPQFKGLRPDKAARRVRREQERPTEMVAGGATTGLAAGRRDETRGAGRHDGSVRAGAIGSDLASLPFEPTHLDKVFFAQTKITKGDLFRYYESVADYILPYLKDRPHSLNRMPDGIGGNSFYQKNNEHLPDWVAHADILSDAHDEKLRWLVGRDLATLLYMVQLGCIEINPWNARVKHLDKPDWAVIDLDPEGVGFRQVVTVARTVKEVCDDWKVACYPKTSGKSGLHVYIPLGAKYSYDQAKDFAHLMALEINKRQPKLTSVERMPAKRPRRIYVDFLQNRQGQTLAAPYSVRPTPQATVSTPLDWSEVRPGLDPKRFTVGTTATRLARAGDLWQPVMGKGVDLARILADLR